MTIYSYLCRMEPEERQEIVGMDSEEVIHMNELTIKQAAALPELCTANLAEKLFEDDRGCENMNASKAACKACVDRFLRSEMPKQ